MKDYSIEVQVYDPLADPKEALHEYGMTLVPQAEMKPAVAVVVAVAHAACRDFTRADLAP
jgi:UDP-N-acetyl-D-galactosamine dehydrogenase